MGAAVWLHILKFKAQNFFKINVVGETSTIFLYKYKKSKFVFVKI
jgi:hypothetical protein